MKLGEALNERARLAKRVTELRDVLDESLIVTEGEEPVGNAEKLTSDILNTIDSIEDLVARINRTNTETTLSDGTSLTEALAKRDALAAKTALFEHQTRKLTHADPFSYRRAASELREIRQVNVDDLMMSRDKFAQERRELDAELQALNWTTELVD